MTKVFKPPHHIPDPLPRPHLQKDGYKPDGTPRRPKWKVRTPEGVYSAAHFFYYIYHNTPPPPGHTPIWLDSTPPLDTSPDNLVLLSTRELKNLVHHNNRIFSDDPDIKRLAIKLIQLRICLNDQTKSLKGGDNNERTSSSR